MNKNELKDTILGYLEDHPKDKKTPGELREAILTQEDDTDDFHDALSELENEFLVFTTMQGKIISREQANIFEGKISIARNGMGYVDRPDRAAVRIEESDQHSAMDGDIVLVQCALWQLYGQVIVVVERAKKQLIGTYYDTGHGLRFRLDDEKLRDKPLKVLLDPSFHVVDGSKVLCDIEKYSGPMTLRVKQVIGHKDDPGVDILSILLDHDIDPVFPEEVMKELEEIPGSVSEEECAGRKDLRNEIIVTIDGDDSKDFDDAVSCEETDDGWILKVSIADVSHYVKEDSPLDKEARRRGCSTYVTDRVVAMLPHQLSNGICSLNPHVDRLTITCEMHVLKDGSVSDYQVYESVIHSTERMTYANVNRILDGDEELIQKYAHLGRLFEILADCADAIRARRTRQGAIEFSTAESKITVDEKGNPVDVRAAERGHAEMIIEDCMIAANVCVANFMRWQEIPSVYRVHEEPSARRIRDFIKASEIMGHKLTIGRTVYPNELSGYLESVKDEDEFPVLSMMLLRCMQKAKYDSVCAGHFGLAEEEYLHFTSPIRRYPDLIVHRMLRKYSFEACMDLREREADEKKCAEYAESSSVRERISQDAEYACADLKKAQYMSGHLGEKYEGIITSVTGFGSYVQLPNTVEGLVRIASMEDDYYEYNPERLELCGIASRRIYRIGMPVKIKVAAADVYNGRIEFILYGKNGMIPSRKTAGRKNTAYSKRREMNSSGRKHGRKK